MLQRIDRSKPIEVALKKKRQFLIDDAAVLIETSQEMQLQTVRLFGFF